MVDPACDGTKMRARQKGKPTQSDAKAHSSRDIVVALLFLSLVSLNRVSTCESRKIKMQQRFGASKHATTGF
jgi:hypothetical protein